MATNKKEAFRQYLEAAGVLDTITKSMTESCCVIYLQNSEDAIAAVLVSLYEEADRPKNAIE